MKLLGIINIVILAACLAGCGTGRYIRPSYLKDGDAIGVISMSSRVNPARDTAGLRHILDSLGFRLVYGKHILDQTDKSFGSDDSTRAAEFMQMIESPQIKAILMHRGGYGAVRTLDGIDWRKVRRNPKWIAGYSDVTMLHLAVQSHRIESIHSDMPVSFTGDSASMTALSNALRGKLDTMRIFPHPLNRKGRAVGRLVGGNLSIIYAAAGTPENKALKNKGNILLIEDVGEKLYHIDRMMQNLERQGVLSRCKAILVGYMTNISGLERFEVSSAEELIARYADKYDIPAVFGIPAGHDRPNLSFYMGRKVEIIATDSGTMIIFR